VSLYLASVVVTWCLVLFCTKVGCTEVKGEGGGRWGVVLGGGKAETFLVSWWGGTSHAGGGITWVGGYRVGVRCVFSIQLT